MSVLVGSLVLWPDPVVFNRFLAISHDKISDSSWTFCCFQSWNQPLFHESLVSISVKLRTLLCFNLTFSKLNLYLFSILRIQVVKCTEGNRIRKAHSYTYNSLWIALPVLLYWHYYWKCFFFGGGICSLHSPCHFLIV